MGLFCKLFHGPHHEELLVWESHYYDYRWNKEQWYRFTHCTKCHVPLLDPKKTYCTPDEFRGSGASKDASGFIEPRYRQ